VTVTAEEREARLRYNREYAERIKADPSSWRLDVNTTD